MTSYLFKVDKYGWSEPPIAKNNVAPTTITKIPSAADHHHHHHAVAVVHFLRRQQSFEKQRESSADREEDTALRDEEITSLYGSSVLRARASQQSTIITCT